MSETKHDEPHAEIPESEDLTGQTLGNYLLIRRLGRGGMADVYLSQQTGLNRPVAIKILRRELARDRRYVHRFHREAEAAAGLIQANIVQIYEVGEFDDLHFIAQEYVRGQNLRQYLNRFQTVEPVLAVSIIRQVALALQRACEQGVIHRDIKPENIMLAPNGEVKVTDFGLARIMDDNRTDLTQIGITMGTPLYMSPEQAEGSRVDARSDIYSLGITAYHMLAGQPPFEGENALTIAVQHVKQEPPPLEMLRPDLPKGLCAMVHKMMAKLPGDRFQHPSQLLKELRTLDIDDVIDWDRLTEKLAVSDSATGSQLWTVPQTRLEVTRQLESIMTGHFRPWWQSAWLWIGLVLMAGAGGLVGSLYAINHPPASLDRKTVDSNRVRKMANAELQYLHAYFNEQLDNEVASEQLWLAVSEYFPEYSDTGEDPFNRLFSRKADERLGDFYLRTQQYDKALQVYERLASLEEQETRFRLVGLAGQTIIYDLLDQVENVRDNLSILQNEVDNLGNDYLRTRINELLNKYLRSRY